MSTSIVPRAGMKRYVTTGGADTSGLNQNSNNMAAWAAIIPAAASLVGSAINGITGQSNVRMQRETNQMNYQMMHEQNRWNREQWNLENAYNSPSAQSARLRQAGINPNAVFGNGSVSEAGSLQSASPTPAVAPQMPYLGADLAQGVYTGVNAYNQSQLANAQSDELRQRAHGLSIQNELDFVTLMDKIQDSNLNGKIKQEYLEYMLQTHDARVAVERGNEKAQETNIAYVEQQTMKIEQERMALEFANSVAPELHEMEKQRLASQIAVAAAQVHELNTRSDLNQTEKDLVTKKITEQVIINSNLPKQLHNENAIRVQTYNQIKQQSRLINNQANIAYWESLDARKGYRKNTGSNRPLSDYIEEALDIKKGGKRSSPSLVR